MRIIAAFLAALAMAASFAGCARQEPATVAVGVYMMEGSVGLTTPSVELKENNEYAFLQSLYSSYLNFGAYRVRNGVLLLTTKDGLYTYSFDIKDNALVFLEEASSPIPIYKGETEILNGSVFVYQAAE